LLHLKSKFEFINLLDRVEKRKLFYSLLLQVLLFIDVKIIVVIVVITSFIYLFVVCLTYLF